MGYEVVKRTIVRCVPLTRRTLVVANLLGTLEAEIFQAPGFGSQFLRPGLVATRVDVINGTWPSERLSRICSAS